MSTPYFNEVASHYLKIHHGVWREGYYGNVKRIIEQYLLPIFDGVLMDSVTSELVEQYRNHLRLNGRDGKALSGDWINHIMYTLVTIITISNKHFGTKIMLTKLQQEPVTYATIRPFNDLEQQRFLSAVRGDFYLYYLMRFKTGLRTGEIDGLQWDNINFEARTLTIDTVLVEGKLNAPSQPAMHRTLSLDDTLMLHLREHHNDSDFVFCNKVGKPLDHRNMNKRVWKPTLKDVDLPAVRPSETRHSAAVKWLTSGISPSEVAKRLGYGNERMLQIFYLPYLEDDPTADTDTSLDACSGDEL